MLRTTFTGSALVVAALAAGCDAPLGPTRAGVSQMQVSAELSSRFASMTSPDDSVILWITIRNPLPHPVTLGNASDYPWWSVTIVSAVDEYDGVWVLSNPMKPLQLGAGADTVHPYVIHVWDTANRLAPGEYFVRGGLDYTRSEPQALRIDR